MIAILTANLQSRKESKRLKLLPQEWNPEADWWLWLDWPFRLVVPPEELIKGHEEADIVGFAHSMRDCAYDEHAACARMRKDDLDVMRRQMDRYRREKFPARFGLLECGVLLRRNTEVVRRFNEVWWGEVEAGSTRDQLSVGYAAWRTGVRWECWEGTVWGNRYACART